MNFETENNRITLPDSVFCNGGRGISGDISTSVSKECLVRHQITVAVWARTVDCVQASVANAVESECKLILRYERYIQVN